MQHRRSADDVAADRRSTGFLDRRDRADFLASTKEKSGKFHVDYRYV